MTALLLAGSLLLSASSARAAVAPRVEKIFDGRALICGPEEVGQRGYRLKDVVVRLDSGRRLSGRVEAWDCTSSGSVRVGMRSPLRMKAPAGLVEVTFSDMRLVLSSEERTLFLESPVDDGTFELGVPEEIGTVDLFVKGFIRSVLLSGNAAPVENEFSSGAFRVFLRR